MPSKRTFVSLLVAVIAGTGAYSRTGRRRLAFGEHRTGLGARAVSTGTATPTLDQQRQIAQRHSDAVELLVVDTNDQPAGDRAGVISQRQRSAESGT